MSNFSRYTIKQVRLIHDAFKKDSRDHVATYVPSTPFMNPIDACEELYSKTQNLETSWVEDGVVGGGNTQFTIKPVIDTRSTCVGDVMEVCYPSDSGHGFKTVTYVVADVGFEKI